MLERLVADWPLKLLALLLAFGIWVAVTGEKRIVKNFTVPLEIQLPEGHTLGSSPPPGITVQLDGPETVIRRLDPLGLALRIDLGGSSAGEREIPLTEGLVQGLPPRASVTLFEPDRIFLSVERRRVRELPVVPSLVGPPGDGYVVYQSRVTPDTVRVEGPESQVNMMTEVKTDPIPLAGKTRPFTATVGAVPGAALVKLQDPTAIRVRVLIDETPIERSLQGVRVLLDPAAPDAVIEPSELEVWISGPPSLVERLEASNVVGRVDGSDLAPGRHRLAVTPEVVELSVDQLARLTIERVAPRHVTVVKPAARASR